jgi:hypothetical protein
MERSDGAMLDVGGREEVSRRKLREVSEENREQSMFRSQSKRAWVVSNESVGPGAYYYEKPL